MASNRVQKSPFQLKNCNFAKKNIGTWGHRDIALIPAACGTRPFFPAACGTRPLFPAACGTL